MAPDDSFPNLVERLKAGDDDAARTVFDRFTRRLIGLASRQLDVRLRQRIDPEDVVQSVYKSFFARFGDTLRADSWDGLWGLLTLITLRKCSDRARFHRAERRDAAREAASATENAPEPWREVVGREPTPDEAVTLTETLDNLLKGLDEGERPIIELSLQGHSTQEISEQLGRAERSVRRLRERVRLRLERMRDAET